jgi:hypothetical protein
MCVLMTMMNLVLALAALVAILDYFGIKPTQPLWGLSMPLSHNWKLIMMIGLVFASLAMSGMSLYLNYSKKDLSEDAWFKMQRSELAEVRNETFVNQIIEIDGKNFHDNVLQNSTLIYRGTKPFRYEHNQILGSILVKVTSGPQQAGMVLVPFISDDPTCVQDRTRCVFQGIMADGKKMPSF